MNTKLISSPWPGLGLMLGAAISGTVMAQSGSLRDQFPELAELYNAFDVSQAGLFDAMAAINADPQTEQARNELQMELEMMAAMDAHEMMGADHGHGAADSMDDMAMSGPYTNQEVQSRAMLYGVLNEVHSVAEAQQALSGSSALTPQAAQVLQRGHAFERTIRDIFANPSATIHQKREQVNAAVQDYLDSDPANAVSATPKSAALYLNHPYANGMKSAFPRLNGLMWTNQWLQLASLEAIIIGQVDPQFAGSVPVTLERYWNKVGSDTGMTMFPAPTEMPSVPAIAPQLYSQAPDAAVIIDNLNMLEAALADVIAYPNLENREAAINEVVAQYTAGEVYLADTMDYLLNALRGGIFNQGGPAIGELDRSERNRSRAAMDMQHTMIMSSPN